MKQQLVNTVALAMGIAAACFLYAVASLESSARFLLACGSQLSHLLPHGRSHYTEDNSWWPWPSLERNGGRIADDLFVQAATGILNLGQCVPIRHANLILPGIVGTAVLSVVATSLLFRLLSRHTTNFALMPHPVAILLSTAIAFPLTKFMHFVWQGLFNEVVFAEPDRWRAEHPGKVYFSSGYPVGLGTFGTSGMFIGALFFQIACLLYATRAVPAADVLSDKSRSPLHRLRRVRLTIALLAVVFLSWPLIVGWISRLAPAAVAERYIPF